MRYLLCSWLFLCALASGSTSIAHLKINGPITPVTVDYINQGLAQAQNKKMPALLIELNTPGGLLSATESLVLSMLNTDMPVMVYVSPKGAQAASAGTFIVYASDLAAMAPGSRLGAATPVGLSGENQSDLQKKASSDAAAWLKSIAQHKNRWQSFAEQAVNNARSITASEALKLGVIEILAKDMDDLLKQSDQSVIQKNGKRMTLQTKNAQLVKIEPSLKMEILSFFAHPNIAYLLLLAGIYGIFFEIMHPGALFPGILGAICLCISAYSLYLLPVTTTGIILIVIGFCCLIFELLTPSLGILALGGLIALFLGGLFFIDQTEMAIGIGLDVLVGTVLSFAACVGLSLWMVMKSRHTPAVNDVIGLTGKVTQTLNPKGEVLIQGEYWQAQSAQPIRKGQLIRVIKKEGLLLTVSPHAPN